MTRSARPGRRTALLLLAGGLPAACAELNTHPLYVLAPVPGPVLTGAARTIALRPIGLAGYLQRAQIVRSSRDYQLDVLPYETWGEPLDSMISRVLVQELTQRLATSMVYAETGAISTPPDARIEINVQRFDLDQGGAVLLQAQFAAGSGSVVSRAVSLSVIPGSTTTASLVAAMSIALGQLADTIAASLARR